jgi:hypothetical protein
MSAVAAIGSQAMTDRATTVTRMILHVVVDAVERRLNGDREAIPVARGQVEDILRAEFATQRDDNWQSLGDAALGVVSNLKQPK